MRRTSSRISVFVVVAFEDFRRRPQARQNRLTFLRNHRDAIAAFDFFVVFSTAFRPLYVWFVIEHARRRVLHVNVTEHPTAAWVV